MKALLLVDMQKDFMPGGALGVPGGDKILKPVNRLQMFFPRIFATQDWHPPHHLSFAASHPGKKPGDIVSIHGHPQALWPVHCVQSTEGAALDPRLDSTRIEKLFHKGVNPEVDSYSGFFDVDAKRSTGLDLFLRDEGIDELYIAGLATDYCVKFTVLDALRCGFRTTLLVDCCAGIELAAGDGERALAEMKKAGAKLRTSAEVESELAAETGDVRYEGKYLRIVATSGWEYAERTNCHAVVVIAAVHEGCLLLTEQFRIPLKRTVLELPAGLAGDSEECVGEELEEAARRELIEETGYDAKTIKFLTAGPTTAGLSNETISFFYAAGLTRVNAGGGVEGERITIHRVPLAEAREWLHDAEARGYCIDPKVFAGLYLLPPSDRKGL